jgi:hypothetical protein
MICSGTTPPPNTGSLTITTSPAYALVTFDGASMGISPVKIPKVSAGIHTIVVKEDGYVTTEQTVSVGNGESKDVHVKMDKCLLPPPLCPGFESLAAGIGICAAIICYRKKIRQ